MIDKSALLAKRPSNTRDVELPTLGGTVRVRGLSRAEALQVQGREMDAVQSERILLALAMVDPNMTEDEVEQWQDVAPAGELQPLQAAILELSGMTATAVKDAMRTFRD